MHKPDWCVWRRVAKLTPAEAAALTMNFCPHTIKRIQSEVSESGSPALFPLVAGVSGVEFEDATEFENRLLVLERNFGTGLAAADLAAIANEFNWQVPDDLRNLTPPTAAETAGLPLVTTKETSKPNDDAKPTKREMQIRALVAAALAFDFEVLSIPRGGKGKIKKYCIETHPSLFGAGPDPFKEAWQGAVTQKRVRTADHHRYVKKI